MPTDVVMPQMGESIAEGTIVRWIKKVGEKIDRDEPLFEISTDKVDAEIPSPAGGVLTEIRVKEGETVPVNSVVAVIGEAGAQPSATRSTSAPAQAPTPTPQADGESAPPRQAPAAEPPRTQPAQAPPQSSDRSGTTAAVSSKPPQPGPSDDGGQTSGVDMDKDELRLQKSSPLVRRIAREHNVDIGQISGSGLGGRVTKADILNFIEPKPGAPAAAAPSAAAASPPAPAVEFPAVRSGEKVEIVPMTPMRRKIAEHMIASRRTSAHVHSVFEVNFSRVAQIREAKKAEYERAGAKLTYMAFILKAAVDAIRAVPVINASVDGDKIVYKKEIHIGVAVALDWGLIVPVVKNADEKNLLGLSRAIADLAERARKKQLKPEEVQGGTFTVTNPGVFGALFGMPIINQPQVAILGVGGIEKRPVIVDDAIAIRPMGYLTLGYDHRIIDGAVADEFMSYLKKQLEEFDPSAA